MQTVHTLHNYTLICDQILPWHLHIRFCCQCHWMITELEMQLVTDCHDLDTLPSICCEGRVLFSISIIL